MRCPCLRVVMTVWLTLCFAPLSQAQVDYETDIKPLLAEKCAACHGVLRQEAGLRLDARTLMAKGGDSGPAILPGRPSASLIIERVSASDDLQMPPHGEGTPLSDAQIARLSDWIAGGAVAKDETVAASPMEHWAFQPIVNPAPQRPPARAIDTLIRDAWPEDIRPQPLAPRSVLIRRLYLDLIGLPPTHVQLQDERPLEHIVDELLQSRQHAERWARHWMDVWRYSDWYGLNQQLRYSQKHMWHWRDWIIDSLHEDKGYDRMITEMLAGDELSPDDADVIAGTGFLARNYYLFNRTTWLDATIEHTGKAFLGLTLNCAKCHDHKYDPISQRDYYQFRALLEPHHVRLDPIPGRDLSTDGLPRVFDHDPAATTWLHRRGNPKDPDQQTKLTPAVPAVFAHFQPDIHPVDLPVTARVPMLRPDVHAGRIRQARTELETAQHELAAAEAAATVRQTTSVQADAPALSQPDDLAVHDTFDTLDRSRWNVAGGRWQAVDGKVVQTTATTERAALQLIAAPPEDFEMSCRYTTTGGSRWKSVVFRFDENEDGTRAHAVYTSAHTPDPKIQVSVTRDGQTSYPSQGRRSYPIKVGVSCELRIAVRGCLVNVWVNDDFQLAWQLPERPHGGRFSIAAFDATVSLDDFHLRPLSADARLTGASGSGATTPAERVERLRAQVDVMQCRLTSIEAIWRAEQAQHRHQPDAARRAQSAAVAQARTRLAEARWEQLLAGADSARKKAAQAKHDAASKQLERAQNGTPEYERPRLSQQALEGPDHKPDEYGQVYPATSTGRRLALAGWLTTKENPLTARVIVNHVWLRHFGEPLVDSVFDFGLRTPEPVHRRLLDFLAWDLMNHGWSFRRLHRQIVLSDAYQRTSSVKGAAAKTQQLDPDNTCLWRMNARRMEAQVVRDSLLHLAGTLDLTGGGPPVDSEQSRRRSLYFRHSRDDRNRFLSMFDDADLLQCYRRSESIVPVQALALANSRLSLQSAGQIAEQIENRLPPAAANPVFIQAAFKLLLGRPARPAEARVCATFCQQMAQQREASAPLAQERGVDRQRQIRTRLIHSLLNHNDFITIR
ncbi:MAG: DUF1553 domain-containing protein [Planctomycetaceae bacterium]|nr:DUF1553 domain-containing protein [Planctomycetaceae bacterium]